MASISTDASEPTFVKNNKPFEIGTIDVGDFFDACFLTRPSNSPLRDIPASQQASYFYPKVKRVVYHDPATIVFWKDGTKTVVKCIDGQPYEKYAGFCAALAKKIYGGTSTAKKIAGAKDKPVKIEVEEPVNEEPLAGEPVTAESVADEVVTEEVVVAE